MSRNLPAGPDPAELPEMEECPDCKGSGVQTDENGVEYDDVCPTCQGEGSLEPEPPDFEDVGDWGDGK